MPTRRYRVFVKVTVTRTVIVKAATEAEARLKALCEDVVDDLGDDTRVNLVVLSARRDDAGDG